MKIGICGATGAVGKELIDVLHKRGFKFEELNLYASERSAGKVMNTPFGEIVLKAFELEEASQNNIVFLCVSGDFSLEFGRELASRGVKVIDNSSAFRYEKDVPLIVPEINPEMVHGHNLIANPNCTTAILAVALYPIYLHFGLQKVIVSTYQATSGAGQPAMDELMEQSKVVLDGGVPTATEFAYPIPFNLIPQIDKFQENGYTKEEMKVAWETRKIFGNENLAISCTAVRIPTLRAHSESVTIETEKPVTVEEVTKLLANAKGVKLVDDIHVTPAKYPMPLTASGQYDVEVGRIRQNIVFGEYGLDFFVCGDQLLKGAALNAVQIAELITIS
jgi:aspartate-semialdehyde dehydrogenase